MVEPRYGGDVNWNGLVPAKPELCERDNWVLYEELCEEPPEAIINALAKMILGGPLG